MFKKTFCVFVYSMGLSFGFFPIAEVHAGYSSLFGTSSNAQKVPAPCLTPAEMKSPRLDLQACSYVFSSDPSVGPKDKDGKIIKYLDLLQGFFKKNIECYYKGYLPGMSGTSSPDVPDGCSPGVRLSVSAPKTVCSISDDEGTRNTPKNYLGQSCGKPGDESKKHSAPWESSQIRGLWVQAVKFYRNQVIKDEIQDKSSLNIHPRCQAIADDYLQLMSDAKRISDNLTSSLSSIPRVVYTGGVNFCINDDAKTNAALHEQLTAANGSAEIIAFTKKIPKASACFLGISRDNRVLMFLSLAKCEVFARVDDFLADFGDPQGPGAEGRGSPRMKKILDDCVSSGIDYGQDQRSQSAGEGRFHGCYDPKIFDFFKNHGASSPATDPIPGQFQMKNEIPKSTTSDFAGLMSSPGLFLFGTIKLKRRRKRIMKQLLSFSALNLLIVYTLTYFGLGCSSSPDVPAVTNYVPICTELGELIDPALPPNDPQMQLVLECCVPKKDPSGKIYSYGSIKPEILNNPDTTQCRKCNPGACSPNADADVKAAGAASAAQAGNTSAQALVSDHSQPTPSGTPDSSLVGSKNGATAGMSPIAGQPNQPSASTSGLSKGMVAPTSGFAGAGLGGGSGRGSGGGPGASLGSGGDSKGGDGNGKAAGQDGSSLLSISGSGNGGAYGSGQGGGGGGGESSGFRYGMGGGGAIVPGPGGSGAQQFGANGSATDAPMTSIDPDDYFTRIALEKSIFKIVHERYQSTTKPWMTPMPLK